MYDTTSIGVLLDIRTSGIAVHVGGGALRNCHTDHDMGFEFVKLGLGQ